MGAPMKFREHRAPCDQPVTVLHRNERLSAVVVNVSRHGARLARVAGLASGDPVRIDLGSGCPIHEAEVRWTRGTYAGLRFARPLDARTMAVVRKSVSHRSAPPTGGWNLNLRELR